MKFGEPKIEFTKKQEGEVNMEKMAPVLDYLRNVNTECADLFKYAQDKIDKKYDIGLNAYVARAKIIEYLPENFQKLLDEVDIEPDIKKEIENKVRALSRNARQAIGNGSPTRLSMIIGPFGDADKNEIEKIIDRIKQK